MTLNFLSHNKNTDRGVDVSCFKNRLPNALYSFKSLRLEIPGKLPLKYFLNYNADPT